MKNMVHYAENEDQKGNLGNIAKKIIMKTGRPGTMFAIIKFHLFGEIDHETENIEIQHNLRKGIKLDTRKKNKLDDINSIMMVDKNALKKA